MACVTDTGTRLLSAASSDWASEATLPSFEGLGQGKQLEGGGAGSDSSCGRGFNHVWKRHVGMVGT